SHSRVTLAGWLLVLTMTALFILHAQLEQLLGLAPDIVLLGAAMGAGVVALILSGAEAGEIVRRRVDWGTLAFFVTLFVAVGALEVSGVTSVIARQLMRGTGGRPAGIVLAVGWSTGLLSSLLANILAVAAFLPVVADLKAQGAT